jgi:hypothetical protein
MGNEFSHEAEMGNEFLEQNPCERITLTRTPLLGDDAHHSCEHGSPNMKDPDLG